MPYEKTEKFLSQPQWFTHLVSNNRCKQAMRNAEELGELGESYTKIPKAVQFLIEKQKNA